MAFDQEKHNQLYTQLNRFCIHAVIGAIDVLHQMAPESLTSYHRTECILNNLELVIELIRNYMNRCWESYHNETDPLPNSVITDMLNVGLIHHPSCLFIVITAYAQSLIRLLPLVPEDLIKQMTTVESTRYILRYLLNQACDIVQNNVIETQQSICCTHLCDPYEYTEGETICLD